MLLSQINAITVFLSLECESGSNFQLSNGISSNQLLWSLHKLQNMVVAAIAAIVIQHLQSLHWGPNALLSTSIPGLHDYY